MSRAAFLTDAQRSAHDLLARVSEFRFDDIAFLLGEQFRRGRTDERRLRRALARMISEGFLISPGRGRFTAGPNLNDGGNVGARLRGLVNELGGFVRPLEAKRLLGLSDDAGKRALLRALRSGPYVRDLPLPGYWTVWRLADEAERLKLILPGSALALDTRLLIRAAGGDWGAPILDELHRRRIEIGEGLRVTRERARIDIEHLLDVEIADAVESALRACPREHLTRRGVQTLGGLLDERALRMGTANALAFMLADLEDGPAFGGPSPADALDAHCWRLIAAKLDADPVALSRGRIAQTL